MPKTTKKNNRFVFQQPTVDIKKTLHKNLEFTATEQYKLLRTNLEFTLPQDEKCPIIGVTSSMRGEGKSTTAINLAYVFAEKGSKVLLIDGDLRIPSVAKKLEIKSTPGLTDLLMGKAINISELKSPMFENWYILPSGDIPPNPSELLGSARMENILNGIREQFDYVIVDLPPVNLVSDALSISGLISGMIVVIREDYTEKKELERCLRLINMSNAKVLGCVLNESKSGGGSYRKYKRYRYSKYYRYYQHYEHYTTPKSNSGDEKK